MNAGNIIVKEKKAYLSLLEDIRKISFEEIKKKGKDLKWLQYAVKNGSSYSFLPNRGKSISVLHKIARRVKLKNPKFRIGYIVDEISYMVNTRVVDEIIEAGLTIQPTMNSSNKQYLNKALISLKNKQSVYGYPWLKKTEKARNGSLIYKDILSGSKYVVKKEERNGFMYFNLKNIS